MCLIAISYQQFERFPLVIAANRDEYFSRPTRSLGWWPEDPRLLAGKDLSGNGTWMGINRSGKFSAITNVREGEANQDANALSRGLIPLKYLQSSTPPENYLHQLAAVAGEYQGFNLFTGDPNELYYFSNRENKIRPLAPGLYGCSNGALDSAWPKVVNLKNTLAKAINEFEIDIEKLFQQLADDRVAIKSQLPNTGVSESLELALSPSFVKLAEYGTRCSTVLAFSKDGCISIYNKDFNANGDCIGQSNYLFYLE